MNDPRTYVIRAFKQVGIQCPQYEALIATTRPDRVIEGLRPWAFDHDPESAITFCSEAFGRHILPFAQAIGLDMIACFDLSHAPAPSIVVINPWSDGTSKVVLEELPDFESWVRYAKRVSDAFLSREAEEGIFDGDL